MCRKSNHRWRWVPTAHWVGKIFRHLFRDGQRIRCHCVFFVSPHVICHCWANHVVHAMLKPRRPRNGYRISISGIIRKVIKESSKHVIVWVINSNANHFSIADGIVYEVFRKVIIDNHKTKLCIILHLLIVRLEASKDSSSHSGVQSMAKLMYQTSELLPLLSQIESTQVAATN